MANLAFLTSQKLIALLSSADPGGKMYVRVVDPTCLALGVDPLQPTIAVDLSKETTSGFGPSTSASTAPPSITQAAVGQPNGGNLDRIGRTSGTHWVEINGKRTHCKSVKDVLLTGLRSIEAVSPGTLAKLTSVKKRTRRIVARDPNDLFDSRHLVKDHAEQLQAGWWVGTNNSSPEVERWLALAADCAGLRWGTDVKTSL